MVAVLNLYKTKGCKIFYQLKNNLTQQLFLAVNGCRNEKRSFSNWLKTANFLQPFFFENRSIVTFLEIILTWDILKYNLFWKYNH